MSDAKAQGLDLAPIKDHWGRPIFGLSRAACDRCGVYAVVTAWDQLCGPCSDAQAAARQATTERLPTWVILALDPAEGYCS